MRTGKVHYRAEDLDLTLSDPEISLFEHKISLNEYTPISEYKNNFETGIYTFNLDAIVHKEITMTTRFRTFNKFIKYLGQNVSSYLNQLYNPIDYKLIRVKSDINKWKKLNIYIRQMEKVDTSVNL